MNIVKAGKNYGWRGWEGELCYDEELCAATPDAEAPVFTYPHIRGRAIIGGHMYRGCEFPNLQNRYFFADYHTGAVWGLRETSEGVWEGGTMCQGSADTCNGILINSNDNQVALTWGEDRHGSLYLVLAPRANSRKPISR